MTVTRRTAIGLIAAAGTQAAERAAFVWRRGSPGLTLNTVAGKELTLHVRLTSPATVQLADEAGGLLLKMMPSEGGLAVQFQTDANPKPLQLWVPTSAFTPQGSHDIVLRYKGPKLDLYADGVLVDEEWPSGSLRSSGAVPLQVEGDSVETVSVWRHALTQADIVQLCGGLQRATQRDAAILGPERPVRQYWRPRGHNTSAGDAMPFFHDGRFHVYYLFDRRHHTSKWGLGAHQWAHMSSTDLRQWQHHPLALSISEEWEASICTGSVFHDNGTWYAFYTTRLPDHFERLGIATSRDGIHFTKQIPTPFAEPQAPYRRGPNRDPFVWKTQSGEYRMLVTAELARPDVARRGGALELLHSNDLRQWTQQPPFLVPGYVGHQPECADLFAWNGWHYLLFGQDGATHYRMARNADGPWTAPAQDILDSPQARVMKTAAFPGNCRIGVSFIVEGRWGGDLVFRELLQRPDGTLGTKTPVELEASGASVPWMPRPLTPGAAMRGTELSIDSLGGFGAMALSGVPPDARIRMRLRPAPGTLAYGIVVRGAGACESGMELRLEPERRRAAWQPIDSRSLPENRLAAIEAVEELGSLVSLDVVTRGDILDAHLNGTRTLIHRAPASAGDQVFLWAHGGKVTADEVTITQA